MKRYIRQSNATNSKVKFEVIKDYDGEIQAYKLGDWYLCKIYTWGNTCNWYIFDHKVISLFSYEQSALDYAEDSADGQGYVKNYQDGRRILIERYLAE